jgi:hypothetical protein
VPLRVTLGGSSQYNTELPRQALLNQNGFPEWLSHFGRCSIEELQLLSNEQHLHYFIDRSVQPDSRLTKTEVTSEVGGLEFKQNPWKPLNYIRGLIGFKPFRQLPPNSCFFKSSKYPGWYFIKSLKISPFMQRIILETVRKDPYRVIHMCGVTPPHMIRIPDDRDIVTLRLFVPDEIRSMIRVLNPVKANKGTLERLSTWYSLKL